MLDELLTHRNCHLQTFSSTGHQFPPFFIHIAHQISFIDISVEFTHIGGDVNIQNISVFEGPLVWNAVANDFIHRRATRFGKVMVVEWRRIRAQLHARFMYDAIDLISGDADSYESCSGVEDLTCDWTRLSHLLHIFSGDGLDSGAGAYIHFTLWNTWRSERLKVKVKCF